jgi:Flp pilus assembly protein TadG
MTTASSATARRRVQAFCRDTDGVILPYVAIMLVVIVGVGVLALDGARYMSLQTQLQQGADALALAAAEELDRLPTSTSRACSAVNNLVTNSTVFGTGTNANVTVSSVQFLSTLPASDNTPITSTLCDCGTNTCSSDNSVAARFAVVTVQPVSITSILPASFFGGANTLSTAGQAVAGFDQVECNITPLFMCNPFETQGMTYAEATQALVNAAASGSSLQRTLIQLQGTQGNNGQYFPGNFGYLHAQTGSLPTGTCGAQQGKSNSVVQAMALRSSNVCVRQSSVNFQTGDDQNVYEAWNVRFDLWNGITGSFKNCSGDSNYPTDVNVRKGFTPGNGKNAACNPSEAGNWPPGTTGSGTAAATGFPLDNNMLSNGSPNQAVTIGNGNWSCGDVVATTNASATKGSTSLKFGSATGVFAGMAVSGTGIAAGTFVKAVDSTNTTVTITQGTGSAVASGTSITFIGYWNTAHPAGTSGAGHAPSGCTAPATVSRYAVYQYEVAHNYASDQSGGGEQGSGAFCSATQATNRRILHVAMLNCLSLSVNGSATNVPVAAFAELFMTLPVPTKNDVPYAEFVGLDQPGNGFTFDQVQLYR